MRHDRLGFMMRTTMTTAIKTLSADYLIVGSGACGMAFLDVLISHSQATAIVVDRHAAPGGHWNDAYAFVRLHQPSAYYGVCSKPLGQDALDPDPLNKGMLERASAAELLAYYADLMDRYVATGRVTYLPNCDFLGQGVIRPIAAGPDIHATIKCKTVDTTYLQTAVPATHPPRYQVGAGVTCIAPNHLTSLPDLEGRFTIVGAGKTGVDACLWLLEQGVKSEAICWIMPRDAWFQNRANMQRGDAYFEASFGALVAQMETVVAAKTNQELFIALEENQLLLRLDKSIMPSMYHGAIMSAGELEVLQTIKNIVRLGRVVAISPDVIELTDSSIPALPNTIYVDCSATGVTKRPIVPVFDADVITVQMVKPIQPVFSAALIGFVETLDLDEKTKNQLCSGVIVPDLPEDWLHILIEGMTNQAKWGQNPDVKAWIESTRLDTFGKMARSIEVADVAKRALLKRLSSQIGPTVINASRLVSQ
jgi:hypothetical protein